MKILLVEDDGFLLDMYVAKFTEGGHTVDSAKSVEAALEKLRAGETFDVVLLDIVMPKLTGLDLLKAVSREKLGGSPQCIVLSNQGEQSDIDAAKDAGAIGYIIKAETIPSEVVTKVEAFAKET